MRSKPDITFFGEKLCTSFDEAYYKDLGEMDLLLIIGTSLKVSPVSDMISESKYDLEIENSQSHTPLAYVPQRVPIVSSAKAGLQWVC